MSEPDSGWRAAIPRSAFGVVALMLVAVGVLMRVNNGLRYPAVHGYDGFGHATYIWYLIKNRRLPLASEGWELFHPPFYYALCAVIWSALRALEPRHVLQVISVLFSLLGLASAVVSFAFTRRYYPSRPLLQFMGPAFVLFLPVHIYTAPMLGNEGLNTVLCSISLYLLLRTLEGPRAGLAAALGLVLGLGLLTKITSAVCVGTSGVVLVAWGLRTGKWRTAFTQLCIIGALLLAVAGWFYVRNVVVFGTPLQMGRGYFFNRHIENSLARGQRGPAAYLSFDPQIFGEPVYVSGPQLDSVWTGAFATTWFDAHTGWFLPSPLVDPLSHLAGRILLILGVVPSVLVLVGLVSGIRRLRRDGWNDTLVVMLVALAVVIVMYVAYTFDNRIYTASKAAYMMPGIVPFSFWFAAGVGAVAGASRRLLRFVLAELAVLVAVIVPVFTYQFIFEVSLGPQHWNGMAVIDRFAGFPEQAQTTFESLATSSSFYLAHENLGSMALEKGGVHKALYEFRMAMQLMPGQMWGLPDDAELVRRTQADYWNTLAVIYRRLKWSDAANEAAQRAVDMDPELAEAQYNRAALLLEREQADAAVAGLQRAIALDPGFVDAHLLLGVAQQRMGDCDAALRTFAAIDAVKTWPRRVFAHATGNGDLDDAAVTRRRWIRRLAPRFNADYARTLCQAERGDVAGAARHLADGLASGRLPAGTLADSAWRKVAQGKLVPMVLPNIVLIMIDTLRADHMGSYGYARPTTPHLDELAARGVRFANAFSSSSWTGPAVASLFSGLLPSRHGLVDSQAALATNVQTLAEQLTHLGYHAAAFSANFVHVAKRTHLDRGFGEFQVLYRETTGDEYTLNYQGHHLRGYDARELTEAVSRWLATVPPEPIFLYVHYLDPHAGYQPPNEQRRLFEGGGYAGAQGATAEDINQLEKAGLLLDAPDLHHLVNLYDGEIRFTDEQVAALLDRIERGGLCANCVVGVLADHGEEFQDHGRFFHGFTLYDEMIHIPLMLYASGTWTFATRAIPQLVQITDLFPTLIELAGGAAPAAIDGRSLLSLLRGRPGPDHKALVTELQPDPGLGKLVHPKRHRLSVRDDKWKLLVSSEGKTELYRIDRDPLEQHDVAGSAPAEADRLLAFAQRGSVRRPSSPGAPLDAAQRERLQALGYIQ